MIQRPVHIDSASDAYFIVDALGKVIADCITSKEIAVEIRDALNRKQDEPDF